MDMQRNGPKEELKKGVTPTGATPKEEKKDLHSSSENSQARKEEEHESALKEKSCCGRYFTLQMVTGLIMMIISIYNIVFIPLQFAFRIKFKGVFLAMELVTLWLYLIDLCSHIYQYRRLVARDRLRSRKRRNSDGIGSPRHAGELNRTQSDLLFKIKSHPVSPNREERQKKISKKRNSIIRGAISWLPFSIVFS